VYHWNGGLTAGWWMYFSPATGQFGLRGAGGMAVRFDMPAGMMPQHQWGHFVLSSVSGGASGLAWRNGVPFVLTRAVGAPPAVNIVAETLRVAHCLAGSENSYLIIRQYPFAATNSDATCLYGAARSLVGDI
jgi:hypothetical protein